MVIPSVPGRWSPVPVSAMAGIYGRYSGGRAGVVDSGPWTTPFAIMSRMTTLRKSEMLNALGASSDI